MGRRIFSIACATILLLLKGPELDASDVGRAGQAGSFVRMGIGARAQAMGGGSNALADDATAAYYNPAGLVFLDRRYAGFTLNSMALDRKQTYIGYAQPLGTRSDPKKSGNPIQAGFSMAWLGAGVDNIDGRDIDGNHTKTYSTWENAFYFSFAMKPMPRVGFGFSGKVLYSSFPHLTDRGEAMSATGFGFDLGLMLKPAPSITVALSVHDLRSRYSWDSQKLHNEQGMPTVAQFPRVYRAGASWRGFSDRILLIGQVEQHMISRENIKRYLPVLVSGGIQAMPYPNLFLRGGIRSGDLTFGAGLRKIVRSRWTQLDYAFVADPVAPTGNHVFSFSFAF